MGDCLENLDNNKSNSNLTADDIKPFDLDSNTTVRIRRNDVSFITADNRLIILIEHQSTINPNMAFRLFLYYIELLQLWIKLHEVNLYSTAKMQNIPKPEFYVAYNGNKPLRDNYSTFKLECDGIKIDVEVKIVDIHLKSLEDTTPNNALAGYAFFYKVYDEQRLLGLPNEDAFSKARQECMKSGYLNNFIDKEDFIMFYKDFLNYDTQLLAEGRAEGEAIGEAIGEARGRAEGAESTINVAIRSNVPFSIIETMAKESNVSRQRLDELMQQAAV